MSNDEKIIYALVEKKTNQIRYVGVTTLSLRDKLRMHFYKSDHASKLHVHNWIRKSKYKISIKVLEKVKKNQDWQFLEKKWIKFYSNLNLTNVTIGGEGAIGNKHTEKFKRKMSRIMKNNKYAKGYCHTKDAKKRIGLASRGNEYAKGCHYWRGKKLSKEHKRKMSLSHLGQIPNKATRRKLSLARIGKRLSEETIRKISISHKKFWRLKKSRKQTNEQLS